MMNVKKSPSTPSKKKSVSDQSESGFFYSNTTFQSLVDQALCYAKKLGASEAAAEVSEGCGLNVSVRNGALEQVERSRGKTLGITVHVGHRVGNAGTSDFSQAAIERAVLAAYDIAKFTAEDPFSKLLDEKDIALEPDRVRELDLFHPWSINSEQAKELALIAEEAAFSTNPLIDNSEGASVSAGQSHFFMANTNGFRGGYAQSRHSVSVSPIANSGTDMQRDSWYSSKRHAGDLADLKAIGRYAAERALSRLDGRKIATVTCPVLFESTLATGLLGSFVQAVSGSALYRKSTFLLDSLGRQVFPRHITVQEDPFVLRGMGSSPFDSEGAKVAARTVVQDGCVAGYFLSSYSARKLGMNTTGNAGGSHNLRLQSTHTQATDDLTAMLQKLGTGLFVTELMGQGVNYVTGDYSRGASGFWVEKGLIAYPVHEITIAGNLKNMYQDIVAVGADAYTYGAKTVGSILLGRMKIAGS
jgi:PmbA protein